MSGDGLYTAVSKVAERRPTAQAVRTVHGESLSYAELISRTDDLAAALRGHGVSEGTTVATVLRNSPGYVMLILAVARLGARYVPLLSDFGDAEIDSALRLAHPTLLITDGHREVEVGDIARVSLTDLLRGAGSDTGTARRAELPEPAASSNEFRMLWSSGSTGLPKAITWRQDKFVRERHRWLADLGLTESETVFCRHTLDVAHATDLHVFAALLLGATLVLADPGAPAAVMLEQLAAERATVMSALPQHYADLVQAAEALPQGDRPDLYRLLPLCGGAHLSKDLITRTDSVLGIRLRQIYGSTEFGIALGDLSDTVQTEVCMIPVEGVGTRLEPLHERRSDLGELILLSDCTSEGYVGSEAADARAYRPGEYWTGDVASRSEAGGYRILGRVTDALAGREGPVLAPVLDEEIEATACVTQTVSLAARPDEYRDEVLIAAHCAPGRPEDEVEKVIGGILDHHGLRGSLRFVDEFPRTPVGKVDKPSLRRLWRTECEQA